MRLRFVVLVAVVGIVGCSDNNLKVGEASSASSTSSGGTTSTSGSIASSSASSTSSSSSSSSSGSSSGSTSGSASGSSTGSSSGSSGGSTGDAAAFCADLVQPLCALDKACGFLDPSADCSIAAGAWMQPCADTNLAFDESAAANCLGALQSAAQSSDCNSPLLTLTSNACSNVFLPNVAYGGACEIGSNECMPLTDGGAVPCQGPPFASCTGTCTLGPTLGESCLGACAEGACDPGSNTCVPFTDGGACQGIDTGCEPGVEFCNDDAGLGYCSPRGKAGDPCSQANGDTCAAGNTCVPPLDGGALFCFTQIAVGQPCPADFSGSAICQLGATCVDGTCKVTIAVEGQPCDATTTCYGSVCNNPDGGSGVCVNGPTLGQPCNNTACAQGLVCTQGICQGARTAGESCASLNCESGDYCDSSNTCRVLGGLGDACDPSSIYWACREGHCDTTGHCSPFKAPGTPCNPLDLDCSAFVSTAIPDDGGAPIRYDAACEASSDGGGLVCAQVTCP